MVRLVTWDAIVLIMTSLLCDIYFICESDPLWYLLIYDYANHHYSKHYTFIV